jgi:hypothetical protein
LARWFSAGSVLWKLHEVVDEVVVVISPLFMEEKVRKALANTSLPTRMLRSTQDYLDVFARFKQKENIEAVERLLSTQTYLESFERSQLGEQ